MKDLGFTLQQVQVLLDESVDVAQMKGMLRLRQAELEEQVADDVARLARVSARLRLIESEGHMNTTHDVVIKPVPATRVAYLSGVASSYATEDIGPAIQPLYPRLCELMDKAGIAIAGPGIAYYEDLAESDGGGVRIHAGFEVAQATQSVGEVQVMDLPALRDAATLIHRGSMDNADVTMHALFRWIDVNGYRSDGTGYAREVYLDCPDDVDKWVTELQIPVSRA